MFLIYLFLIKESVYNIKTPCGKLGGNRKHSNEKLSTSSHMTEQNRFFGTQLPATIQWPC